MTTRLAICIRQPDNDLIAAECLALTGGLPDENGVAVCETLEYVARSSYIRDGVEVIAQGETFEALTDAIRAATFDATAFRIEWMKHGNRVEIDRMTAIVGVANAITEYYPNLDHPKHRFLLLADDEGFTFGEVVAESDRGYQKHLSKPYRTSSALPPRLARAAINLAGRGVKSVADPCCGSGTIPVEAASMGLEVFAADRDDLAARITRANLDYFGYGGRVDTADAREYSQTADALVTDLPYGINLRPTESDELDALLANAARLAPVAVFLAGEDLTGRLIDLGYEQVERYIHTSASGQSQRTTRYIHRATVR
ncbi:MAG: hypothetical protein O3A46_12335 [Candidatus Poribacteria bacterium]|nr:hypothetical protein [Candidatus Poribacteria bacterium]